MKWKILFVALVVSVTSVTDVFACGNKYLVTSRGTRFSKVPVARHDAKILVYAPSDSALTKTLGNIPIDSILEKVGYQPTTVTGIGELESTLRTGEWDVVLVDLSDTESLRVIQASAVSAVLPVIHRPSRTELREAKRTYGEVLSSPTKSMRLIEIVDHTVAILMAQRSSARAMGVGE